MRRGLTEDQVQAAIGDLDAPEAHELLDTKTRTALRVVDLLVTEHPIIDDATFAELTTELDEGELLELSAVIVIGAGWQRMIEAYGIRPDYWSEATPMPWQEDRDG